MATAPGPALGPGDVQNALSEYGPLTDVWEVDSASASAVTVRLAEPPHPVPDIAPSLLPHYEGALVRFTAGALAGTSGTAQWNTTIATVSYASGVTTVTFADPWPQAPTSGSQFTVIRGAGIGTGFAFASGSTVNATITGTVTASLASGSEVALASGAVVTASVTGPIALASGATVDVGTISGAVALQSGATVTATLPVGTTVDIGTVSGGIALQSGATVTANIGTANTVDISGQSIVVGATNTDYAGTSVSSLTPPSTAQTTVAGMYYQTSNDTYEYEFPSWGVSANYGLPVTIVNTANAYGQTNTVTTVPDASRTAGYNVQTLAAGSTASTGLAPTTIYKLSLSAGGDGGGYVMVVDATGSWIATCGVPGSVVIDWDRSGYGNGGTTLDLVSASASGAQVGVAIEYT